MGVEVQGRQQVVGGIGRRQIPLDRRQREDGWTIFFRYQTQGLPVYFSDEGDALSVIITGGAITAFSYRCRAYTALAETANRSLGYWDPRSVFRRKSIYAAGVSRSS